ARAASGHATAAPPSSVMNWRRPMPSMGSSSEPAVPAYRRLRLLRKRPQVLGSRIAETPKPLGSRGAKMADTLGARLRSSSHTIQNGIFNFASREYDPP